MKTHTIKLARCVFQEGVEPYPTCIDCQRMTLDDNPKQPWQYMPEPDAQGACPSFTPTLESTL